MKILTGKDKLAFQRLETATDRAMCYLKSIRGHHDKLNPYLIQYKCTIYEIDRQIQDLNSMLKGYQDYLLGEN